MRSCAAFVSASGRLERMSALEFLHLAAGVALAAAAWLIPRQIAGSRRAAIAILLLDAAPLGLGAALLGVATGRPLFAGLVVLALGAGFGLADHTMRQTLREPVVFSEAVELPQLFTHPHLYLPFAGPGLVIGGAAAAAALALTLLRLEPSVSAPHPALAVAAVAAIAGALWLGSREPLLGVAAGGLRRLSPSGEPFADAVALGPFAMLVVHAVIARAERAARQMAVASPPIVTEAGDGAPTV